MIRVVIRHKAIGRIGSCTRLAVRSVLAGSIIGAASLPNPARAQATPFFAPPPSVSTSLISDDPVCDAKPLGVVVVATLNNTPIVTLSANAHPVTLLLDTGAERTVLTPAIAERIGALPPPVTFQRRVQGIAGAVSSHEVELNSFTAGGVPIAWRRVLVAPITPPSMLSMPLDGVLGADVLSGFDVDLNLPHQRMTLYQRQSCPLGPPWQGAFAQISAGLSRGDRLFFPVQLDRRKLSAIIDTGAQSTILSQTAAKTLGVGEQTLTRDRSTTTRGMTAGELSSHIHQFSQLVVGSEKIENPQLVVTDVTIPDADIVLAIDFLRSRRVWLSFASFQIFLAK